ncbi:MAG: hypothetical protein H7039_09490 [Bryobacteraceae bacterium]|nr:hypothetical protein [Bryobacteraceae bacterium]
MLFSALFLLAVTPSDWVPMRWMSSNAASLELLNGSRVNCLLLEQDQWQSPIPDAAHKRNLAVVGVLRQGQQASEVTRLTAEGVLDGIVLEGDYSQSQQASLEDSLSPGRVPVISMLSRARMRFADTPVVATSQGVWPGIQAEEEGSTKAAPSGAPWINTNGGFLRFARAAAPAAAIWIGNVPPEKTVVTAERYMQAVADAAIIGARWVIALDSDMWKRLDAAEASAIREWKRILALSTWFEQHAEWRSLQPYSQLAIVQDIGSGALYSGGVLDMIAVKHTPVRAVPTHSLAPESMHGVSMAVNVDPSSLNPQQQAALVAFRKAGGATLSGPATWKFPPVTTERVTLSDADVKTLDEIWKEMNHMTGRRNLGARLFNVASMLSNLTATEDGKTAALHLVNYSGYPVENVTVHLLGKYGKATLLAPGQDPRKLEIYENEEGCGVDVDAVNVTATVLLENKLP